MNNKTNQLTENNLFQETKKQLKETLKNICVFRIF